MELFITPRFHIEYSDGVNRFIREVEEDLDNDGILRYTKISTDCGHKAHQLRAKHPVVHYCNPHLRYLRTQVIQYGMPVTEVSSIYILRIPI